jgi:hypothetical protein
MTRKCVQKLLALVLITFTTASLGYSQLLVPVVREINNSQDYVIVIEGRGGTNAKVLMKDGNASSFDFDPNDLDMYPRWKINRITVNRGPNVKPLTYTTYMCTSNNEYFAFGKKGDNKMMTSKEYDKFWEKDEAGNPKYNISDMYHFVYREYEEKDEKHIRLTYHSDKSGITTTQVWIPTWPSHKLKLVLVKL